MGVLRRGFVRLGDVGSRSEFERATRVDSALRGQLERVALLGDSAPGPWECFGIVRDESELTELLKLARDARKNVAARHELNRCVKRYVSRASKRLKAWLLIRRGRPQDVEQRKIWLVARELRESDARTYSWGNLAKTLTSDAYQRDPKLAADRMRDGVKRLGPSSPLSSLYGVRHRVISSLLFPAAEDPSNLGVHDATGKYPAIPGPGLRTPHRRNE
jgi:hypothetical protein